MEVKASYSKNNKPFFTHQQSTDVQHLLSRYVHNSCAINNVGVGLPVCLLKR